jgi:hypothetical protein
MKVISGGGGIDADGNWYELPTIEREMPDDYFKALRTLFKTVPAPHQPAVGYCSQAIYASLKANE